MKLSTALFATMTILASTSAMATSVIGKMSSGSGGTVLLVPGNYYYMGTALGKNRLPEVGCVKLNADLVYTGRGNDVNVVVRAIKSVEILRDSECDGI